jgi:hypothetical protein
MLISTANLANRNVVTAEARNADAVRIGNNTFLDPILALSKLSLRIRTPAENFSVKFPISSQIQISNRWGLFSFCRALMRNASLLAVADHAYTRRIILLLGGGLAKLERAHHLVRLLFVESGAHYSNIEI